ncbi:hypothetical protein [Natronococcus jeotgali]|uniref:Uncharacterized protein n=1 Tax=Natronococcus jeotgali DSM 18795 TaxID=1227498 RepID=L9XLF1_9EURY|nr:hypothetical protein [Natronococcus jeotgali]ELY62604.1 hypothetical protein C492_07685 [Natronococcus jeotgali DSM 18795]
MVVDLLTYIDESDTPEDTLTESQAWALRQGGQAAIDRGDESLSLPSRELSADRWHHWGIGISVWVHDSGVAVLQKDGETIVTDISMLEHVSLVLVGAHVRIGRVTRIGPERGDE